MKLLVRVLLPALACCACSAVESEDASAGVSEQATPLAAVPASAAPATPLAGTEFLPLPLRPTDSALAGLAVFVQGIESLRAGETLGSSMRLDRARREAGGHAQVTALQAWALMLADDAAAAIRLAQPAAEAGCPQAAYALARALHAVGRAREAHLWFERCRADAPAAAAAGFLPWAPACALAAGAPQLVLRDLDPLLLEGGLTPELALLRARALAALGRFDEALAQADELTRGATAEDPSVWSAAGRIAFQKGLGSDDAEDFRRAARAFGRAAALDPQEPRFHFDLGCALDWGGQAGAAEIAYRRALELNPGYLEAFENLVHLLRAQGREAEVRAVHREMLRQPLAPEELDRVLRALEAGGEGGGD